MVGRRSLAAALVIAGAVGLGGCSGESGPTVAGLYAEMAGGADYQPVTSAEQARKWADGAAVVAERDFSFGLPFVLEPDGHGAELAAGDKGKTAVSGGPSSESAAGTYIAASFASVSLCSRVGWDVWW